MIKLAGIALFMTLNSLATMQIPARSAGGASTLTPSK